LKWQVEDWGPAYYCNGYEDPCPGNGTTCYSEGQTLTCSGCTSEDEGFYNMVANYVCTASGPMPINGVCSTTQNTCVSGAVSGQSVNYSTGVASWTCGGLNGGSATACSTNIPVNGECVVLVRKQTLQEVDVAERGIVTV
jgi:hypothetical protein